MQTARHESRWSRRHDVTGFTLIELMVVVMIIAVLLAIAIPTFLGAQQKSKDRSAQSSLRNSLTNAKTIYADKQDYLSADAAGLTAVEPGITFMANNVASTRAKEVSVKVTATDFYAAALSGTGTCFFIRDNPTANGMQFATGTGTCDGDTAAGLAAASWKAAW